MTMRTERSSQSESSSDLQLSPVRHYIRSSVRRGSFIVVTTVAVPALVLLLVEGMSSGVLFSRDVIEALVTSPDRSRQRIQYDPLLGWVYRPNVYVPDVWGPGVYFRTNAQGFRNNADTTARPADGRVRIMCSGDSFTEGSGVDNDHTWCALLAAKDPHLESVNLGQGGYGFDQAYLRYKRDGQMFDHAVHILGFITDDFRRAESSQNWFWHKPKLVLREGVLTTENVPVPRGMPLPKLQHLLRAAQGLRTVQFLARLKAKLGWGASVSSTSDSLPNIVTAVITDLEAIGQARGRLMLLLYLPTLDDYLSRSADPWRERIRAAAADGRNVAYLDLISELKQLPPDTVTSFFIPYQGEDYERRGEGHYTIRGNQWVAQKVFDYLLGRPEIRLAIPRVADPLRTAR